MEKCFHRNRLDVSASAHAVEEFGKDETDRVHSGTMKIVQLQELFDCCCVIAMIKRNNLP